MCLSVLMSAACCAISAVCNCLCCCCKSLCGCSLRQQVKLAYIVIFSLFNLFTIMVMYQVQNLLHSYASFLNCPEVDGQNICVGVSSVLRMALVLSVFHLLMMLAMLIRGKTARSLNEGGFLLKILLIIGGFIGCMYISNDTFMGVFYDICRVASVAFLCFQALMMTDLFYLWGERWVTHYDHGMQSCKFWLPFFSLVNYAIWVLLLIIMGSYFSGTLPTGFMIGQIVGSVIMFVLLVTGVRENGSLLTTSAVTVYSGYWMWSGLASNKDQSQNTLLDRFDQVMLWGLVLDGLMAIVTLFYLTFGMNTQEQHVGVANLLVVSEQEEKQDLEMADRDRETGLAPAPSRPSEEQLAVKAYESNNYVYFHLVMSVISLYLVMVLTNWGVPVIGKKTVANLTPNDSAMYIKTSNSLFSLVLYVWTLVAPRVLPNRQF